MEKSEKKENKTLLMLRQPAITATEYLDEVIRHGRMHREAPQAISLLAVYLQATKHATKQVGDPARVIDDYLDERDTAKRNIGSPDLAELVLISIEALKVVKITYNLNDHTSLGDKLFRYGEALHLLTKVRSINQTELKLFQEIRDYLWGIVVIAGNYNALPATVRQEDVTT